MVAAAAMLARRLTRRRRRMEGWGRGRRGAIADCENGIPLSSLLLSFLPHTGHTDGRIQDVAR